MSEDGIFNKYDKNRDNNEFGLDSSSHVYSFTRVQYQTSSHVIRGGFRNNLSCCHSNDIVRLMIFPENSLSCICLVKLIVGEILVVIFIPLYAGIQNGCLQISSAAF